MTDKILTEQSGQIARIVFNNPEKRNAVSLEMWEAVEAAVERFSENPDVRVLILSGAGGKAFVSGADISKFETERASEEAVAHYDAVTERACDAIEAFARPTIAQIDGYCIGGGVALALACDMRICGKSSQFAIPAARLGLGYGYPGIKRLVDVVGPSIAKEILFTARRIGSGEALAMGLVNRVAEDGDVRKAVENVSGMIAANAPMTVAAVKYIADEAVKDESARDLDECARRVKACFKSADYAEGRRAFIEKRKPNFVGA